MSHTADTSAFGCRTMSSNCSISWMRYNQGATPGGFTFPRETHGTHCIDPGGMKGWVNPDQDVTRDEKMAHTLRVKRRLLCGIAIEVRCTTSTTISCTTWSARCQSGSSSSSSSDDVVSAARALLSAPSTEHVAQRSTVGQLLVHSSTSIPFVGSTPTPLCWYGCSACSWRTRCTTSCFVLLRVRAQRTCTLI